MEFHNQAKDLGTQLTSYKIVENWHKERRRRINENKLMNDQ